MEPIYNQEDKDNSHKKLFLIIDKNEKNILLVSKFLSESGHNVISASSHEETLSILKLGTPDVLFTSLDSAIDDWKLTYYELKDSFSNLTLPILFYGSEANLLAESDYLADCFCDFISFPISRSELDLRIENLLRQKKKFEKMKIREEEFIKTLTEKNEYLGVAAHDMKNPLYTTLGFVQYIERKYEQLTKNEILEFNGYVKTGVEECLQIIHDLLELSALEDGRQKFHLESVNLTEIIQSCITKMDIKAKEKNIRLNYYNEDYDMEAVTDSGKIQVVLDNLLSNALKYSPEDKQIFVKCIKTNGNIRVEIADEGPGIKEDEKHLLFKKFARLSAKPTGNESSTGLGLSIAKTLVDGLKGKIWCESEEGKGSRFIFEIPADFG